MSSDELTPEEVKAIAAEIEAWHSHYSRQEQWHVAWIAHLYEIAQECYLATYQNGVATVFMRDELGTLRPAGKLTYWAPEFERSVKREEANGG